MMKWINKMERMHMPNLRRKKWYKMTKAILLIPFVLPAYYIKIGFQWLITRRKPSQKTILSKFGNIVEGWSNLIIPDPATEEVAKERAAICASCPFAEMSTGIHTIVVDNKTKEIRGMKCTSCGCPLSAKVRSLSDRCPQGKW